MKICDEVSQRDSPVELRKSSEGGFEISLYNDELTVGGVESNLNRLRFAFPKQPSVFFDILSERIIANGFTDSRLKDAINNVIDNFQYKELNIADIIRYNRTAKLYTYSEVCNLVTKGQASFGDFERIEVNGTVYRVKKSDMANQKQ